MSVPDITPAIREAAEAFYEARFAHEMGGDELDVSIAEVKQRRLAADIALLSFVSTVLQEGKPSGIGVAVAVGASDPKMTDAAGTHVVCLGRNGWIAKSNARVLGYTLCRLLLPKAPSAIQITEDSEEGDT